MTFDVLFYFRTGIIIAEYMSTAINIIFLIPAYQTGETTVAL